MTSVELGGLDGRNPMGFFAAVGALAALSRVRPDADSRLSWTRSPIPRAVLHGFDDVEQVIVAVDEDRRMWQEVPALFNVHDDVKLGAAEQREYLSVCRAARDGGRSAAMAAALVAEGAFTTDTKGSPTNTGKPTLLHFTRRHTRFLKNARRLLGHIGPDDLRSALVGPWEYGERQTSDDPSTFVWDYAGETLSALAAATERERGVAFGAEWLALMGICAFPITPRSHVPAGFSTRDGRTFRFAWPMWESALGYRAVQALLSAPPGAQGKARLEVFVTVSCRLHVFDKGVCWFSPSSASAFDSGRRSAS